MSADRPEVTVRSTFAAAAVVFEVRVSNPTPADLRAVRLSPRPIPPSTPLDRKRHLIPYLQQRKTRTVAFRLRPETGVQVVAMDVTVEWEDAVGSSRGRMDVSSRPVDLTCPKLRGPKGGVERWRSGLGGGAGVEVRLRQEPPPDQLVPMLEEALAGAPGDTTSQLDEGPRGTTGRIWVRAEGAKGLRAGLLVDVSPDPRKGGSRVLVTCTATTDELLTRFYHSCLDGLVVVLPGIEGLAPHSLTDAV
jgi:hypothetical protein